MKVSRTQVETILDLLADRIKDDMANDDDYENKDMGTVVREKIAGLKVGLFAVSENADEVGRWINQGVKKRGMLEWR